ncbi:MAG: nuclease [Candidatus Pelagibacter sp.]|nr:nuclease [Candidatus Pelagibacter sp.]|tara:strand:- start:268 stop:711 length:444 start_codon:yes stop_codon:yes gene_type:complete
MKYFFLFFFLPSLLNAQNIKIIDGDTIHIAKIKYRFHGIDAPELSQTCIHNNIHIKCGELSKKKLIEKIGKKKVNCQKKAVDRYKRVVAECYVNNESLSKYLVKNGYAFAYRKYSKKFVEDENYAKEKRLGLWSMDFQYPWYFRRKK